MNAIINSKDKPLKQTLRKAISQKRQAIPPQIRQKKARELLEKIRRLPEFKRAQRLAFYWPAGGEIDPRPLLNLALELGKQCYLPILHPSKTNHLLFVEYKKDDSLHLNHYGILEPHLGVRHTLAPWMFNLIFVPLVGFNREGRRLGRGGGYYDRTFAFLKDFKNVKAFNHHHFSCKLNNQLNANALETRETSRPNHLNHPKHPRLLGLAYEFQEFDNLPGDEWDILLSGVATEERIILF